MLTKPVSPSTLLDTCLKHLPGQGVLRTERRDEALSTSGSSSGSECAHVITRLVRQAATTDRRQIEVHLTHQCLARLARLTVMN